MVGYVAPLPPIVRHTDGSWSYTRSTGAGCDDALTIHGRIVLFATRSSSTVAGAVRICSASREQMDPAAGDCARAPGAIRKIPPRMPKVMSIAIRHFLFTVFPPLKES